MAFPSNQFGGQEPGNQMRDCVKLLVYSPGTNADIKIFATSKYNATFPLFAKIDVKGANAHPLFVYLEENAPSGMLGASIKWNFEKILCDKKGNHFGLLPSSHE